MGASSNGTKSGGWAQYRRVRVQVNGDGVDRDGLGERRNGDDDRTVGGFLSSGTVARAKQAQRKAQDDRQQAETAGWDPWDLGEVLSGKHSLVKPSILERTDGECLFYPGKVHCIFGVSESAKSWLALHACSQELMRDEIVWYLDFEDDAHSVVGDRLVATMGVTDDVVVGQFAYFNPDGPVTDAVIDHLLSLEGDPPSLVVIDGVTEALAASGLSSNSSEEVATFQRLPSALAQAGAAVVLIDHLPKDAWVTEMNPIGSQHKRSGISVLYRVLPVEDFGRGRAGRAVVRECKDRPGHVKRLGVAVPFPGRTELDRVVAEFVIDDSDDDGQPVIELRPPGRREPWKPGGQLKEEVSELLEANSPLGFNEIKKELGGKEAHLRKAIKALVADEFVRIEMSGQKHLHHSMKPYRSMDHIPRRGE
jgi:hypothetical protein